MIHNEPVDLNAFARAADKEVSEQFGAMLDELAAKHGGDQFKAACVANMMISNGINILLDMDMPPESLLEIIFEMMKALMLDKPVPWAMPAHVVAPVQVKGPAS